APAAAVAATLPVTPAKPAADSCEPPASAAEAISHRELGGHYFPVALFVPPALTLSHFGIRAGIEYHSVPGFARDLSFFSSGTAQPAHLQTVNAAETVDFALRLHDIVALVGSGYGLARVGANVTTLLGTGADYTYGGSGGVLVKLFRVAGFQMAVRAEFGGFAGQQAGIVELFQDIGAIVNVNIRQLAMLKDLSQLDLPGRLNQIETAITSATAAMLTPFRGFEYGGSLNMAQSLGPMFGLQLALGLYGRSASYDLPVFDANTATLLRETRGVDNFSPRLGVALDADLSTVHVPLDLMGEYTLTRQRQSSDLPDSEGDRVWTDHLFALGVHYSGLPDLQLGVMGYITLGQSPISGANVQADGNPFDVGGQFVFRYLR
ncbi:MAG TPA: hypothetical protein VJV78_24460, partial [Polyangiales bacterium]|nr:hypothetical protein [Polyangiales bacterium]